jgi:hypothetical protein
MYSSFMNVYVVRLRQHGQLLDLPHIRNLEDVAVDHRIEGHLEYATAHGERTRSLYVRSFGSMPGMGVYAKLYQPTLAKVEHTFLKYRGYEPDGSGIHMQEWLVFPKDGAGALTPRVDNRKHVP